MISGQRTYRLVRGMDDGDREWNSREKAQRRKKVGFLRLLCIFAAIWIVSYPAEMRAEADPGANPP